MDAMPLVDYNLTCSVGMNLVIHTESLNGDREL